MPFSLTSKRTKSQQHIESMEAELLQTRECMERLEASLQAAQSEINRQGGILAALNRSFAVIEFELDGTIISANENFEKTMGYREEEIVGQHHRMFAEEEYAQTEDYKQLWKRLKKGEFISGEFHRIANGGRNVWLRASYNPIFDEQGRPIRVVKFAMDVTDDKILAADYEYQLKAVRRTQAVIEFDTDGIILDANENFLNALGYRLDDIVGQHHRMFVERDFARSAEYQEFWRKLRDGRFHSGQYKRIAKTGNEIWIEASYNPIFDPAGNLVKVVKFATDITQEVEARREAARTAETLASSFTEMTQTINEISRNVTNVRQLSTHTQDTVNSTSATISNLSDASQKIGSVISLISKFADQTNLLALNASVEAARAGDAGRGFAVVASEVKSLALETRKAADSINLSIGEICSLISTVVGSADQIRTAVGEVNENITGVAVAIEQQSATMTHLQQSATHLPNN